MHNVCMYVRKEVGMSVGLLVQPTVQLRTDFSLPCEGRFPVPPLSRGPLSASGEPAWLL